MSDATPELPAEVRRHALSAAARWYAERGAGQDGDADWRRWHDAHPAHQWAWQRVEALQRQLQSLPGPVSAKVLARSGAPDRQRRAVMLGVGVALTAGWLGYLELPGSTLAADHRTGVGERRRLTLPDGSQLVLDTDTTVAIDYGSALRRVRLYQGELMLRSVPDPAPAHRPLVVDTAQGRVRALGTRFAVRQQSDATRVVVFEDQVEVQPAHGALPQRLAAGQQLRFAADSAGPLQVADERLGAWVDGRLVIDDWRLDALVLELSRYRSGWLHCAPEVAALRISGAFPLDDIDAALAAVARVLPVTVRQRARWWTVVGASENNS